MPGTPPSFVPNPREVAKKVAAFGSWTDSGTFVMTWSFIESPHSDTVTCRLSRRRCGWNSKAALRQKPQAGGWAGWC
jgi:hypothetical protein